MRVNGKRFENLSASSDLLQVDFHQFMAQQQEKTAFELAQEFGLSLKDVKYLKEKMKRS
jgi:hypothetical protein